MGAIWDDPRIRKKKTGIATKVTPNRTSNIVGLLALQGVPHSAIGGWAYRGDELTGLARFSNYRIGFIGVEDEELFTRISIGNLFCWQIIIYWNGNYDSCIEATWSREQGNFQTTMKLGKLDALDEEVSLRLLRGGLKLLKWTRTELSHGGRPEDSGFVSRNSSGRVVEEIINKARSILKAEGRVSKHDVAKAFAGLHGISGSVGDKCNKCAGCKMIDRIIKQAKPGATWRDDVLPRINQ